MNIFTSRDKYFQPTRRKYSAHETKTTIPTAEFLQYQPSVFSNEDLTIRTNTTQIVSGIAFLFSVPDTI